MKGEDERQTLTLVTVTRDGELSQGAIRRSLTYPLVALESVQLQANLMFNGV